MSFIARCVVLLLLAFQAAPAHAQTPIRLDLSDPDTQTLVLWNEALARMQAGRPRAALEILEPLVSALPDTTRIRLELARAYFLVGDDEKAQFHFERALGDPLSEPDRAAVLGYLDAIAARKIWEVSFGISLITESNPGQRTDAETIDIGGIGFTPTDKVESNTGIQTRAALGVLPPLSRDMSGRFVVTFNDKSFEDNSFDDRTWGAEAGVVMRRDGGAQFGAGVLLADRSIAGKGFSETAGVYADATFLAGPATRLTFRATVSDIAHDNLTQRDGITRRLSLRAQHVLSSRFALRGAINLADIGAEAPYEAGDERGLSLGATYAFEGGWTLQGDIGLTLERRDAAAPLFAEPRDDEALFVALSLLNRNAEIAGFTPVIGLRYDTRSSPIPLFDYDNLGLTLGFTRQF